MNDINPVNGSFEMMALPYDADALQVISAETLSFHHGKHLKTYIDNLNKLLADSPLQGKSLIEIVRHTEGALLNNAGQVLNHVMYFDQFGTSNHQPQGEILRLINRDFGTLASFQQEFEQKGASLFGSGWVWLSLSSDGKLVITQEANAGNPVRSDMRPLLTFDVWEHAYYLDYQNRRPAYLSALWQIIDWQKINDRLQ